jgi:3D (Asp-Asp-Asp) domain-containing protein
LALAAAAVLIKRNWSTVAPIITHVRDVVSAWVAKNQADIAIVMKAFRDVGAVVRAVFQVAFPVAVGTAQRALAGARTAITGMLQSIQGAINVFLGLLHGDWARVWGGLKDIVAGGLRTALGVAKALTAPFREIGTRIANAVIDGLSMLGHMILNKFKEAAGFVADNVGNFFKDVGGAIAKGVGKIPLVPGGDGIGKLPAAGKGSAALMGAQPALGPFASVGARFGLHVSSGRRPGSITSSGNQSYHSTGEAIDEAGSPAGMLAFFKFMRSTFGSRLAELIYTPGGVGIKNGKPYRYTGQVAADHFDHVHVALDTGKPGVGDGIGKVMGRPAMLGDGLGKFVSTSYGPPWGGIQGTGVTATGVNLKGSPHTYGIAVDPSVLKLGKSYYVQPNPFGRAGPFKAFDTGGAIKGNRIDFYDWRGRSKQNGWGRKTVTVSTSAAAVKKGGAAAKKAGPGIKQATQKATEAKHTSKAKAGAGVPEGYEATFSGGKFTGYKSSAEISAEADHRNLILSEQANEEQARQDRIQQAATEAMEQLNATLQAQNALLKQQREDIQKLYNVSQSQYGVLSKAIADVASGQIGGKVGMGFMSPGFAGGGTRY